MNTNTQTLEYKAVRNMIKQAAILNTAKITMRYIEEQLDPLNEMTDILGDQLYQLLDGGSADYQDWGSLLWDYKDLMQDLLILLAKPGVLAMLHKHSQEIAADRLGKLVEFFDTIDHADTHAFLDYHRCGYINNNQEELQRLSNYYDFDKRRGNEYHAHYFGDIAQNEEWEQNAIAYENAHFAGK